ncbi:hypothetical protein [Parabacteroides distasonis]|uniref:hypothetical protein n=1 Tax=Parabacteroides distasonis TaxID=823 RepID=UPI001E488B94|nr:hypothetical protein [Parabacteroides distasonis]MDB9152140.1 hypothetical protein [Parabacteroides distasonis]MDB9156695.1 hypothetical protein [Parabacteroides distasonis]MDB9165820.1 hypothetical protein [Parabacteroides distasonis]MDB9170228.1 hypothetical protein [Parabacteroides distasonis]MDB9196387.1 hypothetical protein [Parabacteroides distasonis]
MAMGSPSAFVVAFVVAPGIRRVLFSVSMISCRSPSVPSGSLPGNGCSCSLVHEAASSRKTAENNQ